MPKRKEPELDPKEQFKRFVETAKEHGVDESGKTLSDAFSRALRPGRERQSKGEASSGDQRKPGIMEETHHKW